MYPRQPLRFARRSIRFARPYQKISPPVHPETMPVGVYGGGEEETRVVDQRWRLGRLRGLLEPSWSGLGAAWS
eukprot:249601-Pyramimonas_sp.AAC.1